MSASPKEPKTYLRRVQNSAEEKVRQVLKTSADRHGWRVYPAVKLTSVIGEKPPGITAADWKRATRQHLDFLVTDDERNPLFAVELDGAAHRRPETIVLDQIKDRICEQADLNLLRITSKFLNELRDGRTVVEYLIDAYRAAQVMGADHWIHECTEQCTYPDAPDCCPGEVTDYRHFSYMYNGRLIFPNYFVDQAHKRILYGVLEGLIPSSETWRCSFVKKTGWVEAWAWVAAIPFGYLFQTVEVRSYRFPSLDPCALAIDLCMINLAHDVDKLHQGKAVIVRDGDITGRFEKMSKSLQHSGTAATLHHCAQNLTWHGDHFCMWLPWCEQQSRMQQT